MAAAQAPIGVPLARVDTDAVAQRVRVLADVAKVEVHRSWPHTLTIEVTPRVPAAVINVRESWWNVDRDGVLFGTSTTQPASLPVLEAPTDKADTATRAAGVAVLTALPAAVTELIQTVEAKSEADIELTLTDGAVVHWGTADRTQRKAEVLLALIETQTQPPTGYDVSAPDRPAITP
jgi:cell division protein FtsQ